MHGNAGVSVSVHVLIGNLGGGSSCLSTFGALLRADATRRRSIGGWFGATSH
jgi:hypothetical protein